MVSIDLSKIVPGKAYAYLAAFLPGLFFVLSVVLANPGFVARLAADFGNSVNLGRYATLAAALFLAFIIGNGFLLVDTFIQYVFMYLYRFKVFLYRLACKWPLRQLTQWMIVKRQWRMPWVGKMHQRAWTIAQVGFDDWREHYHCWVVFARRLLELRYQLKVEDLNNEDFGVLWSTLGRITPEEFRGSLMLIATHATGWAGLAAMPFAPVLRNKYYAGFCLFLILNGMLHAYYVARRRFDPRIAGLLTVRAVMREFPKTEKANSSGPE